jgi:adenosylcobinamide-GDP ribazoletransferase
LGSAITSFFRPFLLALGFLTRLAPAGMASSEELSASCRWYPLAGAVLGAALLLCLLPILAWADSPAAAAWIYVLASVWLTRGLHLDGLADLADALGSGKTGPAFREVLKDSRLGAFGCLALVLALGGQMVMAGTCLAGDRLAPLFFAPVFARCLPLFLAGLAPVWPGSRLGAILAASRGGRPPALACLLPGPFCLGLIPFLLALAASCALLAFLVRVARREGGYNGDFAGALIIGGECAALAAAALGG